MIITDGLKNDLLKKFKEESKKIFKLMYSLKENPKKGKIVGEVRGIVIEELKYKKFRFYFITNGFEVKFLEITDLQNLVIKFVKMSDKKTQQKTINEIKDILRKFREEGF
ncbi:hypothetical protein CEE44_05390 [Candidatus Woesearchaeota archaeon B3_Woes]|nr:MAG: hypothetical protein CEE44_05390 [Candidatus Woesearchaeota archaeon B3_Woes]